MLGRGRLKVFWNSCFGWFCVFFFSFTAKCFFEGIGKVVTSRRGELPIQAFGS